MKTLLALSLMTLISLPSHALVTVNQTCVTSDGEYEVTILNNQGIGFSRTGSYEASIADKAGNKVASFVVEPDQGIPSASFGRAKFIDKKTQGHKFSLAFPSTNYRHISLLAVLADGETISDEGVSCK